MSHIFGHYETNSYPQGEGQSSYDLGSFGLVSSEAGGFNMQRYIEQLSKSGGQGGEIEELMKMLSPQSFAASMLQKGGGAVMKLIGDLITGKSDEEKLALEGSQFSLDTAKKLESQIGDEMFDANLLSENIGASMQATIAALQGNADARGISTSGFGKTQVGNNINSIMAGLMTKTFLFEKDLAARRDIAYGQIATSFRV